MKATFTIKKETPGTIVYQEEIGEMPPCIKTIYVQKWAANKLGGGTAPETITVTIEAA